MKNTLIFDLDGTILNTLYDIHYCVNKALSHFGYEEVSMEKTISSVGYGAKILIELVSGFKNSKEFDELFNYYVKLQAESDNSKTVLYDGLDELLLKLKKEGYTLAIISNKPDSITQIVCEQKLKKYGFDYITGNKPELFNPKPDKSCVLYYLDKYGINKENVIYIGDSEVDVKTFKSAGVDGIGVLWGFRKKQVLEEAGCKYFASTADELYKTIKSFN